MTDRERLIDLIIEAKRTDPETGSFTEYLADYLIAHGVVVMSNKPKSLLKDENPFNTDVYCSFCGTNLSGYYGDEPTSIIQCFNCGEFLDNTKSITREEAEKVLNDMKQGDKI